MKRTNLERALGRRILRDVERLTSFTEDITRAGYVPGAKTLALRVVRHARACRQQRVLFLHRLRFAGAVPVCVERTYLPVRSARFIERRDLQGSLYRMLEARGERLARSEEFLTASAATAAERRLLKVPSGVPLVRISRLAFDRAGRSLEYAENALRADRYGFRFALER